MKSLLERCNDSLKNNVLFHAHTIQMQIFNFQRHTKTLAITPKSNEKTKKKKKLTEREKERERETGKDGKCTQVCKAYNKRKYTEYW